jgi:hypothetical protein
MAPAATPFAVPEMITDRITDNVGVLEGSVHSQLANSEGAAPE